MTEKSDIEFVERLTEIDVRLKRQEEMTDYLNKVVVRGNGQPSIVAKVDTVLQFMKDYKDDFKYWSRFLVGGFILNIIGYAFAAIVWFAKIYPAIDKITQLANTIKIP